MKILITGGNGSIAGQLSKRLIEREHDVSFLSRNKITHSPNTTFLWDIKAKKIDAMCIDGVDVIVHLAGAGIADKRWTNDRKKELIESRTESIKLIYQLLKRKPNQVKSIISASASGYYSNRGDEILTENSLPNSDFLAECCMQWEAAVDEAKEMGLRVLKFRTGVVLEKNDGALKKIAAPIKYGFGAALGNGYQWISWIHIQDVIDMYVFGIENEKLSGVYNMSSPKPITNLSLTQSIAKIFHKPLWLPKVHSFFLKLALGEMSLVVLGSTRMNVSKILKTGFKFTYPDIDSALSNIYDKTAN